MTQYRSMLAIALFASVAAACDSAPTATAGSERPAVQADDAQTLAFGMDADYARIAEEVPGFGGAFIDDEGRTVVHMVGRDLATEGDEIRSAVLERLPARPGRVGGELAADRSSRVVLRNGAYDWSTLMDIEALAGAAVIGLDGVVYTDIDERSNRVTIGIEARAAEDRFREAVAGQGVPDDAVRYVITPPIHALKGETLQQRLQPMGGGAQLVFPHPLPGFIYLCTLGFNASFDGPGQSDTYFFTNSHCTFDQGAPDGTPYYQQGLALPDERYHVADEIADPGYFPCYGGAYLCRYSDAALARYRDARTPVEFGGIHRTDGVNTGSLDIAAQGPKRFTIVGEAPYPLLGDELSKMGRTTGWTRGEVVVTCADILQSGTTFVIGCQDIVVAGVGGGDSGSPVFMQHGDSKDVTLYGILWGGGSGVFVFSAMDNIHYEFGDFDTN